MSDYYGGIMARPQGERIKDNVWGFGRSMPEIYTDSPMPVNCKIASGRDESDFYAA